MVDNGVEIIAEIANTHNGVYGRAETLVRLVAGTGADAIKFQVFRAEDLVGRDHQEYAILKERELSPADWQRLFTLARNLGLTVCADVFAIRDIAFLTQIGCEKLKIHSSDIHNMPLIQEVGATNLPVILSLGGTRPRDTWHAADCLVRAGCQDVTLLVGFQAFPTRIADSNLHSIAWYRREFGLAVGYADHTDAESPLALVVPLLAVAAGAAVIEKHITFDRDQKPDDYESAIEPEEFRTMVHRIREAETALGASGIPALSSAEVAYARRMKKYPVASRFIRSGDLLSHDDVLFRRLGEDTDAYPADLQQLLGRPVQTDIPQDSVITNSHFKWTIGIFLAIRSHSTRLPGKAFAKICGKYSVDWLIERVKRSTFATQFVLCTTTQPDDDRFVSVCEKQGISIFRGSNEDVMGRFLCAAKRFGVDIIVRVTGDDLLSDPVYIDRAVQHHLRVNAEYTSVVGLPDGVGREVISTAALEWVHGHIQQPHMTEYMTWFLDEPAYVRASCIHADPEHCRPDYRLTLDTSEDLDVITWIFSSIGEEGQKLFGLDDIIKLLDSEPNRVQANADRSAACRGDVDTRMDIQIGVEGGHK